MAIDESFFLHLALFILIYFSKHIIHIFLQCSLCEHKLHSWHPHICVFVHVCSCLLVNHPLRSKYPATVVCPILTNPWNYFCLCVSVRMAADSGSLFKSHVDIPTRSYEIDAQPRSGNRLGCSLSVWRLTARLACLAHRDIMSPLLDIIQPNKQNCSWGEETSGCQSLISLWTGLGLLPRNKFVLFRPKKQQAGNRLQKMFVITHLKSSPKFCEDFCHSLLASVHFSFSNQLFWLHYLLQRDTRSSQSPHLKYCMYCKILSKDLIFASQTFVFNYSFNTIKKIEGEIPKMLIWDGVFFVWCVVIEAQQKSSLSGRNSEFKHRQHFWLLELYIARWKTN